MERKAGTAVKPGETELARQLEYIRAIRAENDAFAAENGRKKKFYSLAMGCQMNAHDSEKLEGMLDEMGFDRTDEETEADFIIYNTCCVRENAEQKVYGKLGWLKHYKETKNPDAVIALCGCMMQQETVLQTLRQKYRHVDIVFGTFNLYKLPELVATRMESGETVYDIWQEQREVVEDLPAIRHFPYKASVNIMFGCNNFCSYCIVPYVRGPERSRNMDGIVAEAAELAEHGIREIMLLGQNVAAYGLDGVPPPIADDNSPFAELLERISAIDGIRRIRFTSPHPAFFNRKLIETIARLPKVCKCIHLPLQSGSDRILRRMNRPYDSAHYMNIINSLRALVPGINFSTDIIVGFPGETEEDFEATRRIMREAAYDNAFIFKYSPRKGTVSSKMADDVPQEEKERRNDVLLKDLAAINEFKNNELVGQTFEVLAEGPSKRNPARWSGRTDTFKLVVFTPADGLKPGDFINVRIERATPMTLYGTIEQ